MLHIWKAPALLFTRNWHEESTFSCKFDKPISREELSSKHLTQFISFQIVILGESPPGPGWNIWKLLLCLSKSWQASGFRTCQQYVKLYQPLRLWEWRRLSYSSSSQRLIHAKSASSNKNSFSESSNIHGNWKWLRWINHISTFHLPPHRCCIKSVTFLIKSSPN